jgi:predicted PurR-regulated permease PerM
VLGIVLLSLKDQVGVPYAFGALLFCLLFWGFVGMLLGFLVHVVVSAIWPRERESRGAVRRRSGRN